MTPHRPFITERPDRTRIIVCKECLEDWVSSVPIGIGMSLRDRETAERLAENHRGRMQDGLRDWGDSSCAEGLRRSTGRGPTPR
jgi:hypothetical protein